VSGANIAEFALLVNAAPVMVKRTYYGCFNASFIFGDGGVGGIGYTLNAGDVVTVTAWNYSPLNTVAAFEGTVQVVPNG
jgi:hypothetical protein